MQTPTTGDLRPSAPLFSALFSVLLGFVAGCALQLQQETLWNGLIYGSFVLLDLVLYAWIATNNIANDLTLRVAALLLAACLGFWVDRFAGRGVCQSVAQPRAGRAGPGGDRQGGGHAAAQ